MGNTIFTATGCIRCKVVKQFMLEQGISYVEKDMKAEGKEDFQKFYAANRKVIVRGAEGVEFPLFVDEQVLVQGIGMTIAYLQSGRKLDGFFSVGTLHKEWVDGIHVSGGNPEYSQEFLSVLRYLKRNGYKLQVDTNGKNSLLLSRLFEEELTDNLIMAVQGPLELYGSILGEPIDDKEVEYSIALTAKFPAYRFETTVVPVMLPDGKTGYLQSKDLGETARLIQEMTGSNKNPYTLRLFKGETAGSRFQELEPMTAQMLLAHRSAARRYQVQTEIEKE